MIGFWLGPSCVLQPADGLCPRVGKRTRELSGVSFIRALIPTCGGIAESKFTCPTHCGAKKTPKVGDWIRERMSSGPSKNRWIMFKGLAGLQEGVGGAGGKRCRVCDCLLIGG